MPSSGLARVAGGRYADGAGMIVLALDVLHQANLFFRIVSCGCKSVRQAHRNVRRPFYTRRVHQSVGESELVDRILTILKEMQYVESSREAPPPGAT